MPDDLQVIRDIEAYCNATLTRVSQESLHQTNKCYLMRYNRVVGLNLWNCFTGAPSLIKSLTALETLDLCDNKLTDLSPLQSLTRLRRLDLRENQITDLSPLRPLTELQTLWLNNNHLTDLSPLEQLTQLEDLRLYKNSLKDLSALKTLTQLRVLYLGENQLDDLSPLQALTNLEELYLGNSQLTNLTPLKELTQLQVLRLSSNQINDLAPLQSLRQLRTLWLNDNLLTDINLLQELRQLNTLELSNNKITHLPSFITQWDMEIKWERDYIPFALNLYGNPLETPPLEIVKKGKQAIRNYFAELQKNSTLLLQCKFLLVGSGEVGKTTLMRTLTEPGFQLREDHIGKEKSTHGIHIKPWTITCPLEDDSEPSRELTLHTWDFGGQDIYLSTHQFFLTKRSLYIFVWEARKDEDHSGSFDYWLNVVKLLGEGSPVIVVMNKADARLKHIDEADIREKFPNIAHFLQVSCLDRTGITDLEQTIRRVLGRMPHLKDRLPKSWQDIRQQLEAEEKNHIDADRYYQICLPFQLEKGREGADRLSDYLHDLGAILRFRTDPVLKNTLILNPEWATEAVYKLIDTRQIIQNKGRFHFNDLETIWDPQVYPPAKHKELIRLMEKFELCFNFTGCDTYIVPELVPNERPGIETDYAGAAGTLRFQYRYDFMPKGIVSRFIARNYYLVKDEMFWKNGVELVFEEATALVVGDTMAKTLKIWAQGPQKRELMAIIRNELNHIHGTLNMKKEEKHYKEEIPCNCDACKTSQDPHLFPFDKLKTLAEKRKTLVCMSSYEDVLPEVLLRGYESLPPIVPLYEAMLTAVSQLQGKSLDIHKEENSRTGVVALLLKAHHGYHVQEQVRWGRSERGKDLGELDLKIDGPGGQPIAIGEAFNLPGLKRSVISRHVKKIFDYDANGLPENFILVYADEETFDELWRKYVNHLREVDYLYPLDGAVKELNTGKGAIKCVRTTHSRHDKKTDLVHLFIRMQEKKERGRQD